MAEWLTDAERDARDATRAKMRDDLRLTEAELLTVQYTLDNQYRFSGKYQKSLLIRRDALAAAVASFRTRLEALPR